MPTHSVQPNLVYVFADQLRYSSCGYAGDERARTPNIDRLATESTSFVNAVSGHPVCAPYRASLLTGKYSSSTGMVINELRLSPHHECFGHVLHRSGYDTAYIGKWHLWANQLGHHHEPDNAFVPPGPYRLGFDGYWAAYNFWHNYYTASYYKNQMQKVPVQGYEPDVQTDLAISWIEGQRDADKPFALFLSYGTPHDPWNANNVPPEYYRMFKDVEFPLPPNYSAANDPYADQWGRLNPHEREMLAEWRRIYYAMVANLDWNLGRLLAMLDSDALANTIVIFTSDHGELFGAHGRRAKNICYEEAIRVPFLIRWPGRIPAGHLTDVCLNTPDIMPTLLTLMDLPVPREVEGLNLSRSALGQPGPEPEAAFLQGMGCTAAWQDGHEWRAVRDKRYTYARMRVDGAEYLFDHRDDPYQMHNLAACGENGDLLTHYRALLKRRMAELGDTFEACTWYRDRWTRDRVIMRP